MPASRQIPSRFLVFGAGATGSVFAARLAARNPVAVVARGARLAAIRGDGIRTCGATEARFRPRADHDVAALAGFRPDFVLVCVKATGTASAARALAPLGAEPVRVSLQNGLGNEEILAEGGFPVVGAVSNNGATLRPDGVVFHAGVGEITLGAFGETRSSAAGRVAACLEEARLPVRRVPDIRTPLWEKAILNAAANPVTALLGLRTGEILEQPGVWRVVEETAAEAVRVARAEGLAVSEAEAVRQIRQVARATRGNRSSMLQDLERGVRTEIGAITGVVVERAAAHGIPVPWNRLMLRLVRARERQAAAPRNQSVAGPEAMGRAGSAHHSDHDPE